MWSICDMRAGNLTAISVVKRQLFRQPLNGLTTVE